MKHLSLAALSVLILAAPLLQAEADILVAPTRVVFERGDRSAELAVVNRGDGENAYRISLENKRMLQDGTLERIDDPLPGELFAKDYVRFAPRRMVLAPGGQQTLRISMRPNSALPPGEYRSHLRFMAVPTSASQVPENAASIQDGEIGINLIIVRSLTVPVIMRVGDLTAEAVFESAAIEKSEDEYILTLSMQRSGNKSTYGNVLIYMDGVDEPVFRVRGIAVYAPNTERDIILAIPQELRNQVAGQPVRIVYEDAGDGRELLAELRTTLN